MAAIQCRIMRTILPLLICAAAASAGTNFRAQEIQRDFGVVVYKRASDGSWTKSMVDDGGMAAEDLAVADLNGDGRLEIIAAGRATANVKIYWNEGGK